MRKLVKSLFFPSFLGRLDEKLLLERPWLWSTRLHRVAWPALLLALLSLGLGMFTPVDRPYTINQFITLGTLGIVLAQVGLVIYWLYGQDAYSTEREHGIARDKTGWREFGTYFGALSMIGLSLFLFLGTVRNRAQAMSDHQFAQDLFLIHLVQDMEHRNREVVSDLYDGEMPDWSEPTSEAQHRANEVLQRKYEQFRQSREVYEANLMLAAGQFVPDGKGKQQLLETYIFEGYYDSFGTFHSHDSYMDDYWNEDEYLYTHLNVADLRPIRAEWEQDDYSTLFNVLSRYSGTPVGEIEKTWEDWAIADAENGEIEITYNGQYPHPQVHYQFDEYIWEARSNADQILNFAFNPTFNFALLFWAIVGAIAVHLSLLRFTFKHSGVKGFVALLLSVVGLAFTGGLYTFIGNIFYSRSDYYGDFMEKYMSVGMGVVLLLTAAVFLYTRTLSRRSSFTWKMAISLYMLPILLAVSPFMLFGIEETMTQIANGSGWFSKHFMGSNPAYFYDTTPPTETWSLSPLGNYMLYFSQFLYVPLLAWLKRSHTRLMSLPR